MNNINQILTDCNNKIEYISDCINTGKCNACRQYNQPCEEIKPFVATVITLCDIIKVSHPIEEDRLKTLIKRIEVQQTINPYDLGGVMAVISIITSLYDTKNRKKIFISHSSDDKTIVDSFVENILRLGCGLKHEDIVFTSIESTGIKTGEDMRQYLKHNIINCDYVFFMISENYKASGICLNEMGAAWVLNKKVKPFLFPNLDYNQLEWLFEISKTSLINNASALGTLHDEMIDVYGLIKHNTADWDKQRQKFINTINNQKSDTNQ